MKEPDLAAALFEAFEKGDVAAARSLCTEDMVAYQNLGPAMDLDSLMQFSAAVSRVVQDFHYEDARRSATETGFVEEHNVCGKLPDGSDMKLAACVVADLRDGKVSHLREYVDTAAAKGLLLALASAS